MLKLLPPHLGKRAVCGATAIQTIRCLPPNVCPRSCWTPGQASHSLCSLSQKGVFSRNSAGQRIQALSLCPLVSSILLGTPQTVLEVTSCPAPACGQGPRRTWLLALLAPAHAHWPAPGLSPAPHQVTRNWHLCSLGFPVGLLLGDGDPDPGGSPTGASPLSPLPAMPLPTYYTWSC